MVKAYEEYKKRNKKILYTKIVVFMSICLFLSLTLLFSGFFESFLNKRYTFSLIQSELASNFKVHFIDVGQGDCTFIEVDDTKIMIDTGTSSSFDNIRLYLKGLNYDSNLTIDYLILTHTDNDHIGGAKQVITNYKVKNVYRPKLYSNYEVEKGYCDSDFYIDNSYIWNEATRAMYDENINIRFSYVDEEIAGDNFHLNFFSPLSDKYEKSNDYCPIMILDYKGSKILFAGDASSEREEEFLDYYSGLVSINYFDIDILKVPHHGSNDATSDEFLSAVKPEYSIISSGQNNFYTHPHNETINRLNSINCKIFRTDISGSIFVCLDEYDSFKFRTNYASLIDLHIGFDMVVVSLIIIVFILLFKPSNRPKEMDF